MRAVGGELTLPLAALVGYLLGSLSGARLVGHFTAPGRDLSRTRVTLDGTGESVVTVGVSSSMLLARAGERAGLTAAAIDILKAFTPAMAAHLLWPEGPEDVLAAAGAVVGHVLPVYHRFAGGFGMSPLMGGLLAIDWPSLPTTVGVGAVVGIALGSAYLTTDAWPILVIPWFAWRGDMWGLGFALLANGLYWWKSAVEAVGAARAWRRDPRPWKERIADVKRYPDYSPPEEDGPPAPAGPIGGP